MSVNLYGTICANCGGDYAIHHYETNQCPVGGREAPEGRKQEWKSTAFEPVPEPQTTTHEKEYQQQKARIAELEKALRYLVVASFDVWDNRRITDDMSERAVSLDLLSEMDDAAYSALRLIEPTCNISNVREALKG